MKKIRTQAEINIQIEGLKKEKESLPQFSSFGDNNWDLIDAQLDILEGKKIASDFDQLQEDGDTYDLDEQERNSIILDAVETAEDWLCGKINENLFSE